MSRPIVAEERERIARLLSGARERELLDALEDPRSAGRIHVLGFGGDPLFAAAVDRTLLRLRRRAHGDDLLAIDEAIRRDDAWRERTAWDDLRPADVARLGPGALESAASHPSGFVREEALRRLAERRDGTELASLLVRANDWVGDIRRVARIRLAERIEVSYARHWVRSVWLWDRLERAGRDDHSSVRGWITQLLRQPAALPAIDAELGSGDPYVRRRCHALALENDAIDRRRLFASALEHADPVVRLWAIRSAAPLADPALVARATRDRSNVVRLEAVRQSIVLDPQLDRIDLLFDRSASIRDVWQRHLRARGVGPAAIYRRDARAADPIAILGIGETGTAADVEAIEEHLLSERAAVRAAAVSALDRLDGARYVDDFLALLDDSPRVARVAANALLRRGVGGRGDRLEALARGVPHARRSALRLIGTLPRWRAIEMLVHACREGADAVAQVDRWLARYNRGFTAPTRDELDALERAISECTDVLGESRSRELRAIASSFRR